jgi:hypothetical protein
MPRLMPPYSSRLQQKMAEAIELATAGDMVIALSPAESELRKNWHVNRIELLYELAYLRMFIEWERFLEESFIRYLCGYHSRHGTCHAVAGGVLFASLAAAETALLNGRAYMLWHNPTHVAGRSRKFFNNGFHELVVSSNASRLEDLGAVRHRIVHDQDDARQKFDNATMGITGRRYRGARPGRLLRDWDRTASPPRRWLESFGIELTNLARQIA